MPKNGSEVKRFDSQINSNHNDGTAWFSRQSDRMYFTRCFNDSESGDDFCQLMYAQREGGIWGEARLLPFIEKNINYGHPTLIENDSVLVFSADLEEPGGPKNLFYSVLFEDGSWSYPEKMPAMINSPGNEVFPTGDGDTLYFSSDFWQGHGGFDIFKTYLRDDKTWSKPVNLGYPVNSGADDFSFVIDYSAKPKANVIQQGYFVSSRTGMGKDDLYFFNKYRKQEDTIPAVVKEEKKLLYITVKTFTPEFAIKDDPNSGRTGKRSLGETLIKIEDLSGKVITTGYADANGFFYTLLPLNTSVKIIAAKLDYLNASREIRSEDVVFSDDEKSKTINTELILDKIYINREIILNNIYYDYDKWDIKDDAKPTLDILVKLLEDNPQVNIQLGSHTDCRGSDEYNMELSQKRAQSVVNYLSGQGIEKTRLIARGFGETRPVESCVCELCTEAEHQKNRRTTFAVVKK
jgi:outer membrane protein OmpA-like peptidoglycan-associated protein